MTEPPAMPSRAELHLEVELMDGELSYREARRALRDLDRVNRLLLGAGAARRTLVPRIVEAAAGEPVRLLDLGAGSGWLACRVARAAARRGARVRLVILDRRLTHLAVAGERFRASDRPLRVAASVDSLPFRDRAFDWTFSNLVFHHFGGRANRQILGEMRRCARRGATVVDLRRSGLARWLVRLLFPLLGIGRVARYDGLLSLAQSWRIAEVEELVEGLPVAELRRRFPFRWSLVVAARAAQTPSGLSSSK
jgi:ubiquinone/menaquinone biosynthesis C-methylase UbiE